MGDAGTYRYPLILAWGLSGLFAHYTMARALKLADITIVSARLPASALDGVARLPLIRQRPSILTAVGGIVIFAANYYGVREEARRGDAP